MLILISPPLSRPYYLSEFPVLPFTKPQMWESSSNGETEEAPNLTLLAESIKLLPGIGQVIYFAGSFF